MNESATRILLLGGGFGGLYTAVELEKRLADRLDLLFSKDLVQYSMARSQTSLSRMGEG